MSYTYLKKGTGSYPKINYPVLRRSGTFQPPPDTQPRPPRSPPLDERREESRRRSQPHTSYTSSASSSASSPRHTAAAARRSSSHASSHSSARPLPPPPPPAAPSPLLTIRPPAIPRLAMETGLMGQRSPSISDYSRTSDSPPRTTAFGSSSDRRGVEESDEGMGREMGSTSPGGGELSGRPRTAGTVDSGFPRDEPQQMSPVSSAGETNASSFPSMLEDATYLRLRPRSNSLHDDAGSSHSMHSPHFSPPIHSISNAVLSTLTPIGAAAAAAAIPLPAPPPRAAPPAAAAVQDDDDEEVMVEPTAAAAATATVTRPMPSVRRSLLMDRSHIGDTTTEFEQREQRELRGDRRDFVPHTVGPYSSNSSLSTVGGDLRRNAMDAVRKVRQDQGEEPFFRRRMPYGTSALQRDEPLQKRVETRELNSSASSSASVISPIDNSRGGRPASVQEFEGASFNGTGSGAESSHFRIAVGQEEEEEQQQGHRQQQQQRQQQLPARRRSVDEGSEASSGSTCAARRFLGLADRRPLDQVGGASTPEITGTQQRPRYDTRASQATRRQPITIHEEESYPPTDDDQEEEEEIVLPPRGGAHHHHHRGVQEEERVWAGGRGRGGGEVVVDRREAETARWMEKEVARRARERVRPMEDQLRDAIAHADLADAAHRRMRQEIQSTFDRKMRELATAYASRDVQWQAKEADRADEWAAKKQGMEEMRKSLENEKKQLNKNETAKVKEWRTKFEAEQAKYAEEKKKTGAEVARRRLQEDKAKKELDEAAEKIASLSKENDRMRNIIDNSNRQNARERGQSALRVARTRAEDEAAAGPRRNGLQRGRFGGSTSALADKENRSPANSAPQGILKKTNNQVRFADTTFTVQSPYIDDRFYETARGDGEWGPSAVYENALGERVQCTTPACRCVLFHFGDGSDLRHFNPDREVTFNYQGKSGRMEVAFPKMRCMIYYYPDGTLEIYRTGKDITKCKPNGERFEQIKKADGTGHFAEYWKDNTMRVISKKEICNGTERGQASAEPLVDQYYPQKTVTHRKSWTGESCVRLHSNTDLEFFEPFFYIRYDAADRECLLIYKHGDPANEMRYTLRPGGWGEINHFSPNEQKCVHFGYQG